MKFLNFFLFFLLLIQANSVLAQSNSLRVANTITSQDLNELCQSKYLEMYAMSRTETEFGSAITKIFFLVDRGFLTRAANSGVSPQTWGAQLGETFRYFCEKSPPVSVRTAAKQTINKLGLDDFIYIHKQPEFDIWYHGYPDYYYGEPAEGTFWIRYQIRSIQTCENIKLHFFLIYDEKKYPLILKETCSKYTVTGDRGFPIPSHIQEIIKDKSRLKTEFSHVEYLN